MARKAKPEPAEHASPPSTRELAALLGTSHAAFRALTRRATTTCEWRRHSNTSPWVLKVSQGDRTLFYVTPKADQFDVTVVLGERAVTAALAGRVRKALHASIRSARPYVEGRPVRVAVTCEADVAGVEELVAVKLKPDAGSQ